MNQNVGLIHLQSKLISTDGTFVFKEGASLRVKVLGQNKDGSYSGFIGGNKINFQSKVPLNPGQSFIAKVSVKDNLVNLVFKENHININDEKLSLIEFEHNSNVLANITNPNLINYFSELNIPSTVLSYEMLLQLKQLGLAFDPAIFNKIYKLSLKFKNHEKIASQLALLLIKKDLEPEEEFIDSLLGNFLDEDFEDRESNNFNGNNDSQNPFFFVDENLDAILMKNILEDFFVSLTKKEFFDAKKDEKNASLSFLNHFKGKNNSINDKNWIFVPYEFLNIKKSKCFARGYFALNLDWTNKLTKLNFHYFNYKNSINFSFLYKNQQIDKIYFSLDGENKNLEKRILKNLQKTLNMNIPIEIVEKEKIEFTASGLEQIYKFGAYV